MRKFLIAIAFLLGVMFIIGQFAEVEAIVDTLKKGDIRFILLAFCMEAIWFIVIAYSYKTIFKALGMEEKLDKLILLSAAVNFVNVVAPSAGVGGIAVFVSHARQKGYSPGKVTLGSILYLIFDYAGFLCILTLGLIVLFRRNNLNTPDIIASAILFVIAASMVFLMYLGAKSATSLGNVLAWCSRLINRILWPFIHREYLSETHAYEYAKDTSEGLMELRHYPNNLITPAILALLNKALLLSILLITFLAFKVPFSSGTIIAGFSIGYLFLIVSPTPAGIGFVEGILTITLSSLYVPLGAAAVIALAYRGVTFWAPLLFGMFSMRLISRTNAMNPSS